MYSMNDFSKCKEIVFKIRLNENEYNKEKLLAEIKKNVESKVSKYAIPRDYVLMDSLPKTAVGKIDYKLLISEYLKK